MSRLAFLWFLLAGNLLVQPGRFVIDATVAAPLQLTGQFLGQLVDRGTEVTGGGLGGFSAPEGVGLKARMLALESS